MDRSCFNLSNWNIIRILGDDNVLEDVLREIDQHHGFSKSQISKSLDISEGMLNDLINQLIRMDYLNEIESSIDCDTPCTSCPYAKSCNIVPVKMYQVSHKGKNLLKK